MENEGRKWSGPKSPGDIFCYKTNSETSIFPPLFNLRSMTFSISRTCRDTSTAPPPPTHTHTPPLPSQKWDQQALLWYLLYTRDGVRGWACWNKPWGFMVILPDCHLGWSWTNLGHLGQIECNNVIDTLEAASSNSTQTLWNSDDVFVNIFTNTFFHFIESTNLS